MGKARKAVLSVCNICGGDGIRLDSEGCLEVHNERVVTPAGVSSGMFLCAGSGEKPEPEVPDAVS